MQDLRKVNSARLYAFWKNLSVGIAILMGTLVLSRLLPFYFSPIIGLLAAATLYTLLYNNKLSNNSTCMIVPYAMFYCTIAYSFVSILLNVLDIWSVIPIPKELSFFNDPYMPALLLDPVCLLVLLIFFWRRNRLSICIDCRVSRGMASDRGRLGEIIGSESQLQIKNLIGIFAVLTVGLWVYYFVWYYKGALVNARDWYVFVWVNVIVFLLDEVYFAQRYYNMYLDLKESGEIITEAELSDMTTKTYLRFYVICGNRIFVNTRVADTHEEDRMVVDTPFLTKRNVNGITTAEVHGIVQRMTGVRGGELRFFFGRKSPDLAKHRILRYFYFLDGKPEDHPEIGVEGEWVHFDFLKMLYNDQPAMMARTLLSDLTRMSTVVLTQKIFDERGYRRIKVKSYVPSFDLEEIRKKDYDFQDDKWIRISMFNSDTRSFHIKRMLGRMRADRKRGKGDTWQGR